METDSHRLQNCIEWPGYFQCLIIMRQYRIVSTEMRCIRSSHIVDSSNFWMWIGVKKNSNRFQDAEIKRKPNYTKHWLFQLRFFPSNRWCKLEFLDFDESGMTRWPTKQWRFTSSPHRETSTNDQTQCSDHTQWIRTRGTRSWTAKEREKSSA